MSLLSLREIGNGFSEGLIPKGQMICSSDLPGVGIMCDSDIEVNCEAPVLKE